MGHKLWVVDTIVNIQSHQSAPQLVMELIRNFIPNAEYENFLDQPMQEQIVQLREAAVSKVREVLDPIQLAQQNLLSGIA